MTPSLHHVRADGRSSLAALLSFVFPGLGQAYNGQGMLAAALVGPVLVLVALVILALVTRGSQLLSSLLDIRVLVALVVLDVALLGWRLVAILQAHGWREPLDQRRWTTYATAALVAVTLFMHAVPAWYATKAIDTLNSVSLGGTSRNGGGGVPNAPPLPEPSDLPEIEQGERINALLVGVDSTPDRVTSLTDTMLVVSLDPDTGRSAMISVPRDLYGVPLPDGTPFNQKLNALMSVAGADPVRYPLGGVGTLKATIGDLLGIDIHYFAAVNLLGFKQAIDAVGGVDVTVERAVNDPTYIDEFNVLTGFFINPGAYHMDGHTALAYVRSRKGVGDSDFTRADRQQQLLAALQAELTAGNLVVTLPALLDAVKNTISTDIPAAELPRLAQAVQDADMRDLERVVLQPPEYMGVDPASAAGYILIPDLEAIRALGVRLMGDEEVGSAP
ncbi:MAG TPA: LCP family protein [Candidatus Limnocylindria bacterium]|nr:LCP family protein [Candidatus Limnocylindria bacterium]